MIRVNGLDKIMRDWKPFLEFLQIKYNNGLLAESFEV